MTSSGVAYKRNKYDDVNNRIAEVNNLDKVVETKYGRVGQRRLNIEYDERQSDDGAWSLTDDVDTFLVARIRIWEVGRS